MQTISKNIIPFIWGPHVWFSIDCFLTTLPDELYRKDIDNIMAFYKSLATTIPCNSCKLSYIEYSKEPGTDIYDIKNFKTKDDVIALNFNLRNKVNKKLELDYYVSLQYYTIKLNYLICDDKNKLSYIISNLKEAPYIQDSILDNVLLYLKRNSSHDIELVKKLICKTKSFLKNCTKNDFNLNNEEFKLHIKRCSKCLKYRKKINKNRIFYDYDIDQSFKYDNDCYIKLFSLGCNYFSIKDTLRLIGK